MYFDFSKAFDRVSHRRLISKMRKLQIDNKTLDWIDNYLTDRKFRVKVNGRLSSSGSCPSGVPQGSCVGPLLFCIFILDLPDVLPKGIVHKPYADDLKLYTQCDTPDGRILLQSAIDAVSKWCEDNEMLISLPKCAILSSSQHDFVYTLNGSPVPKARTFRDLGVIISPLLNFDEHITDVVRSCNCICNTIFRCFVVKEPKFYLTLYNSLVVPKLLYCSEIWRPYLKKHIDALNRVQDRFIRRVCFRCGVAKESIVLATVAKLHEAADLRMFRKLGRLDIVTKFVNIRVNNLRSGKTISAVEVPRTERVNNLFSWRMARMLR